MSGINLGLVPKSDDGHIDYHSIPSMQVRLLVINEEIKKYRKLLKRKIRKALPPNAPEEEIQLLPEHQHLTKLIGRKLSWTT